MPKFDLDRYLHVVDLMGREVKEGKCGHIPRELPPILDRLGAMDAEAWVDALHQRRLHGSVVGDEPSVAREAASRGRCRLLSAIQPG